MTKLDIVDGARNYRLMTRQMLNSVLEMAEYNRYLNGIYAFVGYNTKWISYDNKERVAGKTNFSLIVKKYSVQLYSVLLCSFVLYLSYHVI